MFLSKILKTALFQSLSVEWPVFFVKYIYIFWLFSAMTFGFFEQCSVMNTTDLKSDNAGIILCKLTTCNSGRLQCLIWHTIAMLSI